MNKIVGTVLAISATALTAPTASAQSLGGMGIFSAAPVADGNAVLTVTGQGDVRVAPDLVLFRAGVTTVAPNAQEALRQNAAKMQGVIQALRRQGIATRDIQTRDVSLTAIMSDDRNSRYSSRTGFAASSVDRAMADIEASIEAAGEIQERAEPTIVGYRATNIVVIRQRELGEFGQLIDALVAAGANDVDGPDLQLEDQQAVLDEARAKAIAEARRRAELHAQAAGMRIVRIMMIDEGSNRGLSSRRSGTEFGFWEAMEAGYPATPTEVGELTVSSTMGVMFELAPR